MNTQSVQKFVLATRKKAGHASYISYGPYGKRPTSRTYRRLKNAFMKNVQDALDRGDKVYRLDDSLNRTIGFLTVGKDVELHTLPLTWAKEYDTLPGIPKPTSRARTPDRDWKKNAVNTTPHGKYSPSL